ncbi:MAG: flagellar protein FlaG [Spirochaetaceae bacterium]|jgi:flagellar protein FlaG|nr:flagellar protein FlaG [Spirochaetaceae bacterium]
MGMPIAAAGTGIPLIRQHEIPQDRGAARPVQIHIPEQKAAAVERFAASLPGQREAGEIPHDVNSAAADIERLSFAFNRKLRFVVDHKSKEVTVKVIDPETDKVIKVLPPEELQRIHRKLKETIGFLFDEQV